MLWVLSVELTCSEWISSGIERHYSPELLGLLPPCPPNQRTSGFILFHLFRFWRSWLLEKRSIISKSVNHCCFVRLNCHYGALTVFGIYFCVVHYSKIYLLNTAILFCLGFCGLGVLEGLCWDIYLGSMKCHLESWGWRSTAKMASILINLEPRCSQPVPPARPPPSPTLSSRASWRPHVV